MDFRNYRVKSMVNSFRDLEVYQKTIQLSDEITNLPFLNKEIFKKDNEEIKLFKEAKETLDKLLTIYQTQKIKVLNLRKAWDRVFTDFKQNDSGKTNWRR